MYIHEKSGAELYQPVLQPHVETFSECFTDAKPYEKNGFGLLWIRDGKGKMAVSSYCMVRDGEAIAVRPADWVLSRIKKKMLLVPNDRLHFQIVDHGNGWALVIVSHGIIIGSRWLAYIRSETIPFQDVGRKAVAV